MLHFVQGAMRFQDFVPEPAFAENLGIDLRNEDGVSNPSLAIEFEFSIAVNGTNHGCRQAHSGNTSEAST